MKSFSKRKAIIFGWEKFKKNILLLVGILIITSVVPYVVSSISEGMFLPIFIVTILVGALIQIWIEMGATRIILKIHDNLDAGFKDFFEGGSLFIKFLLAKVLSIFVISLGFALFIIPGIIASLGLSLVPYIILDKKLGPVEAIKDSWRLTKGHKWNLLLFTLLLLILNMLGSFVFIVGLLITVPVSSVASVYVYKWLDKQDTPVAQDTPVMQD